jgi:hypothetical protein
MSDAQALPNSELNGFLFAQVGEEPGGLPLSVLSVLARLELDPWQEARRLANLPARAAVEALAQAIAAMPAGLWPLPAATAIAERLVGLLPSRGSAAPPAAARALPMRLPSRQLATLLLVAAAVLSILALYVGR